MIKNIIPLTLAITFVSIRADNVLHVREAGIDNLQIRFEKNSTELERAQLRYQKAKLFCDYCEKYAGIHDMNLRLVENVPSCTCSGERSKIEALEEERELIGKIIKAARIDREINLKSSSRV